jgi:3-oxoacyl-(acyl-carrier-protein) synthase
MHNRVVVTGMGVVSPNAIGLADFHEALLEMRSGIAFIPKLKELGFSCQIGGIPEISEAILNRYFSPLEQKGLLATGLIYGVISGLQAWEDAKLSSPEDEVDYQTSIIFGTGILGVDKLHEAFKFIDDKRVRRLGSTSVVQTMASGISAYLGGKIGAGNQVTTNSSACTTGTEAFIMGYERIKNGQAKRALVGSCSDSGPYVWGGFDALRILPNQYNENPTEASKPLDANACGFVPSSGAGAMLLEDLDSAKARNATIYAEVLGGNINSGAQRQGGSMTAPNPKAVQKCIQDALVNANVKSNEIDAINGHLTGTKMDATEMENWKVSLNLPTLDFPRINSLKGMIGHPLAAAGSVELVASILQIHHNFIFGNLNLKELHLEIANQFSNDIFPKESHPFTIQHLIKASFGFGDVNAAVVLKKYKK